MLKLKTPEGTIVVENIPDDAVVTVDHERIEISRAGGSAIQVSRIPGRHRVRVTLGDREFDSGDFEIAAGDLKPLHVALIPRDDKKATGTNEERKRPRVALEKLINNSIGMKLKLIPAGEFFMGLPDNPQLTDLHPGEVPRARPGHPVRITRPFYIGVYEVTQEEYTQVAGNNPSQTTDSPRLPVDSVSWFDAIRFCNELSEKEKLPAYYKIQGKEVTTRGGDGYRLPTEAEWEYACRAARKRSTFTATTGSGSTSSPGRAPTAAIVPTPWVSFDPTASACMTRSETCSNGAGTGGGITRTTGTSSKTRRVRPPGSTD